MSCRSTETTKRVVTEDEDIVTSPTKKRTELQQKCIVCLLDKAVVVNLCKHVRQSRPNMASAITKLLVLVELAKNDWCCTMSITD